MRFGGFVTRSLSMQGDFLVSPATKDPLFRAIEETHSRLKKKYGVILDAGTGGHSLKWLATLPSVDKIVAVSADLSAGEGKGAKDLRSRLDTKRGDALLQGSWCADQEVVPNESCDTILCDYLIGSMDGFTPYKQDQLFDELKTKLKPGGLIHVVGLAPVYTLLSTHGYHELDPPQKLVVDVARTRDACILLAGHRTYREYPLTWIDRQLKRSGFEPVNGITPSSSSSSDQIPAKKFGVLWKHATLKTQLDVARRKLDFFHDNALASAMRAKIDALDQKAKSLIDDSTGVVFGYDYVLSAILPTASEEEDSETVATKGDDDGSTPA